MRTRPVPMKVPCQRQQVPTEGSCHFVIFETLNTSSEDHVISPMLVPEHHGKDLDLIQMTITLMFN